MTSYVVQSGKITDEHVETYRAACEIVASLEDGLTCHDVCSVVAKQLGLQHVRGYFTPGFEHSWCEIPGSKVVIDCYPILCASGPMLVDTGGILNPWRRLYIELSRTHFAGT
jgi:hypothetical protein